MVDPRLADEEVPHIDERRRRMGELAGGKPHRAQTRSKRHEFNLEVDRLIQARKWPGRHQWDRK
eukprot:8048624-Alexandrium_andersonii.AAC.1